MARAAPNPVYTESDLTYTIAVINRGPLAAAGVVVTDSLPASVSFVSAQPSPAVLSDGVLSWNVGSLSNGASASETVIVRPNLEGALTNAVSVSASSASRGTGSYSTEPCLEATTGLERSDSHTVDFRVTRYQDTYRRT